MVPCWMLLIVVVALEGVFGRAGSGPPRAIGRVVGGQEVDIGEFTYQLSLEYDGYHICGASVVAPRLALTAGHCCIGTNVTDLTLRGGSTTLEAGGTVFKVNRLRIHPEYDDTSLDYDVCVVRIIGTFLDNPNISVVQLTNTGLIPSGEQGTITGWGAIESNGNPVPNLRAAKVKILSTRDCLDQTRNSATIMASMMCAGTVGRSFCIGDSGGPLVYEQRQVGIVSFVINECGGTIPAVYTRLSNRNVRDFIRQQINAEQRRMLTVNG